MFDGDVLDNGLIMLANSMCKNTRLCITSITMLFCWYIEFLSPDIRGYFIKYGYRNKNEIESVCVTGLRTRRLLKNTCVCLERYSVYIQQWMTVDLAIYLFPIGCDVFDVEP